jgi:hypothetical protein
LIDKLLLHFISHFIIVFRASISVVQRENLSVMWLAVAIAFFCLLGARADKVAWAKESQLTNGDPILNDVRDLIKKFSYAMDLSLQQDMEVYETISTQFVKILPKCEKSEACVAALVNAVLRGMYNLYSHITKDQLASGQAHTVSVSKLEQTISWAGTLLDFALRNPFVSMPPSCSDTNPFHLAAMFRMHTSFQKLLRTHSLSAINCKAVDIYGFSPLHIAILNRDTQITELLLSHCADISSTDSFNRTAVDLAVDIFHESDNNAEWINLILANKNNCLSGLDIGRVQARLAVAEEIGQTTKTELLSDDGYYYQQQVTVQNTVIDDEGGNERMEKLNFRHSLCPIETVHASNLTVSSFVEHYLSKRKPLLIKGGTDHWRIRETWQRTSLAQWPYANLEVLIGSIPYADVFGKVSDRVRLGEFVAYLVNIMQIQRGREDDFVPPYYIFDPDILARKKSTQDQEGLPLFYDPDANAHPQWLMDALMTEGLSSSFSSSSTPSPPSPPPLTETDGDIASKTEEAQRGNADRGEGCSKSFPTITKQFYMGPALSVSDFIECMF